MCTINSSESFSFHSLYKKPTSKRHSLHVRRLVRWRRNLRRKGVGTKKGVVAGDMQMKNLKLYMENQSIIEENQRLRNKALLLQQENQSLFAQLQLQKKFSK